MEFIPILIQPSNCCLNVTETKNDLVHLQQEVERLSLLEEKCNRKLDEFYSVKLEFKFMLKNVVYEKLGFFVEAFPSEKELIEQFVNYVESTWLYGADKLGQSQKKVHYISLAGGLPLSLFLQNLNNKLHIRSLEIAQSMSHPYCTSTFYSMYSEITKEHFLRLSTASICLRQYFYLKKAIPFLEKLKELINYYVMRQNICSMKMFCDEVTSGIILSSLGDETQDDKENLHAFRHVVNLLTGRLLGEEEILDPHTEIRPIVCDKNYAGKKTFIKSLVNFYLKDELDNDDGKVKNSLHQAPLDCFDSVPEHAFASEPTNSTNISAIQNTDSSQFLVYSPDQSVSSSASTFINVLNDAPFEQTVQFGDEQKLVMKVVTPKKRGRRTVCLENKENTDSNCDLKPIKIPKLEIDLLQPLN